MRIKLINIYKHKATINALPFRAVISCSRFSMPCGPRRNWKKKTSSSLTNLRHMKLIKVNAIYAQHAHIGQYY